MATRNDADKQTIQNDFDDVVNMSTSVLTKWLTTDDSQSVGLKKDGNDESVGHESGKKIITILGKKKADLTDGDYAHMQKVVSYVRRHSAQKPAEVEGSNWLYSLKNWGHDATK